LKRKRPPFKHAAGETLDAVGLDFDIAIQEYLHEKDPGDFEAMALLAEYYTLAGRFKKGLEVDIKLVERAPLNPIVHYNLACSYSLLKNIDASLDELEMAVRLGYEDADHLDGDPDLENVKSTPRFRSLLKSLKK